MLNKFLIFLIMTISIFATKDFDYRVNIKVKDEAEYYKLQLTEDIYKTTKNNLGDIRIFDKNSEIVPYFITNYQVKERSSRNSYTTTILDDYTKEDLYYLEFKVDNNEELRDSWINTIVLDYNTDYYYEVKIYGSYDNKEWQYLGLDSIYKVQGSSKEAINISQSKYKYYRLVYVDNLNEVKPSKVEVFNNLYNKEYYSKLSKIKLNYDIKVEDEKTIIKVDNPSKLPIKLLEFETLGNYNRRVNLISQQTIVHSDNIYNFDYEGKKLSKKKLNLNNINNSQEYEIEIYNGHNRRVNIQDIHFYYQVDTLIFQETNSAPYTLYIGSDKYNKVSYDIEGFAQELEAEKLPSAKFQEFILNREVEEKVEVTFFEDYGKLLINIIIFLTSALLILVVLKNLGKKSS